MTKHLRGRITGMVLTALQAGPVSGQSASPDLRDAFATVSRHLVQSAEMVPDTRYSERPTPSVRTFLSLIAHVADGNNYYCRLAAGESVEWAQSAEDSTTTKEAALAALKASVTACTAAYSAASARPGPLIENLAHASLHYGNVIVYLRAMGFTPPSS